MKKKELQKLSDEIFEKTGARMNVDMSFTNINVAFACEEQRQKSAMPEIPVISEIEMNDCEVFNQKMDAFGSNYFFFLKEQEKEFDEIPYPSSFYANDSSEIITMLNEAIREENQNNTDILIRWLKNAKPGDRIRIRKYLPSNINGKVAVLRNGESIVEDTNEYVIILEAVFNKKLFDVVNAYPI